MPNDRPDRETHRRNELLEVLGFDLLAQVEEMLRHVREYQREVQRLRGMLGAGQTSTEDRPPSEAVQQHLKRLRATWTEFGSLLDEIEQISASS
jgi:hypothetical protein